MDGLAFKRSWGSARPTELLDSLHVHERTRFVTGKFDRWAYGVRPNSVIFTFSSPAVVAPVTNPHPLVEWHSASCLRPSHGERCPHDRKTARYLHRHTCSE